MARIPFYLQPDMVDERCRQGEEQWRQGKEERESGGHGGASGIKQEQSWRSSGADSTKEQDREAGSADRTALRLWLSSTSSSSSSSSSQRDTRVVERRSGPLILLL